MKIKKGERDNLDQSKNNTLTLKKSRSEREFSLLYH